MRSRRMASYGEEPTAEKPFKLNLRWLVALIPVILFGFLLVGSRSINFWLNFQEFDDLYIKPLYFGLIGGSILSLITLFRVDFRSRTSLTWGFLRVMFRGRRGEFEHLETSTLGGEEIFRLGALNFVLWQITKVLVATALFANTMFGLALYGMSKGWDPSVHRILGIVDLAFVTPPFDMAYATTRVAPAIPTLTLLLSPVLSAIGLRIFLLTVLTHIAKRLPEFLSQLSQLSESTPQLRLPRISRYLIEALAGLGLLWVAFTLLFPSNIDYNTRYMILGTAASGIVLLVAALYDRISSKKASIIPPRRILVRLGAVFMIILITGSIMIINNSIADARKVEWLGTYTTQQIAVNRYIGQLDAIKEIPYNLTASILAPRSISEEVRGNRQLLDKVRLWDGEAAFAKLKPEIGLIPYVDFQDSDILRFGDRVYWSASMKPVLPQTVRPEDRWYAERLVYTHVPNGFLLLDGNNGTIVDTAKFFEQRRIYYGEGGLLSGSWAGYPISRTKSAEVGEHAYAGNGGVGISPPLSWIFEFNFLLAFPSEKVHVLRYRDVYERLQLLFPYFTYSIRGQPVDMYPVTDGSKTYWAMPLLVTLNTNNVPWSNANPMMRHVGYALAETYNGDIQLVITGNDFFSQLFKTVYRDYVTQQLPEWFKNQARYPEEFFEWRVGMYNTYHVKDPATFIQAKEFFEVPRGLDTYYIIAKPPSFQKEEYIAILSVQLRGSPGQNLAGYMVIRNDEPNFGEMIFYKVPLDAPTKLLGPTAILEALERNPEFATLRTLLRSPRVGNNMFYTIGDRDVYFMPVYTAGTGGVVTQLATVAAVSAVFTGEYFVALGSNAEEAYRKLLGQLRGVELPQEPGRVAVTDVSKRRDNILTFLRTLNVTVVQPKSVAAHVSFEFGAAEYFDETQRSSAETLVRNFVQKWVREGPSQRVLLSLEGERLIRLEVLINLEGVVELHYITVSLERA